MKNNNYVIEENGFENIVYNKENEMLQQITSYDYQSDSCLNGHEIIKCEDNEWVILGDIKNYTDIGFFFEDYFAREDGEYCPEYLYKYIDFYQLGYDECLHNKSVDFNEETRVFKIKKEDFNFDESHLITNWKVVPYLS